MIVSVLVCVFSLLSAIVMVYMDKEADRRMNLVKESKSKSKLVNIKMRNLKKLGGIYWIYAA